MGETLSTLLGMLLKVMVTAASICGILKYTGTVGLKRIGCGFAGPDPEWQAGTRFWPVRCVRLARHLALASIFAAIKTPITVKLSLTSFL